MFLYPEKQFLESLKKEEHVQDHFPDFIVEFLEERDRLRILKNRVKF